MASRLGQHLLRAKCKAENFGLYALYPCCFCICCLAAQWPTFDCYQGNSLTHPMLITTFGLSIFGPKVTKGVGSLHLIEFSVSFDHNAITHLATHPKFQKILSPDLHPIFTKCGNPPNTQNSYSLITVGTLPLFIGDGGGTWGWVGVFEKIINQEFFVKMGVVYRRRVGKHCFSLIRYGFCRDNDLYSSSLLILCHMLLIKVLFTKKACKVAF